MILFIGAIPLRKGIWLSSQDGSVFNHLAKFRNDAAAEEFKRWARQAGLLREDDQ